MKWMEKEVRAVQLYFDEQLKPKKIAQQLGTSVDFVYKTIRGVKAKVKRRLSADDNSEASETAAVAAIVKQKRPSKRNNK